MNNAAITSTDALCALREGSVILDSQGAKFSKFSSGSETTNPNWIAWVAADGSKHHTDEIALPAQEA